mmetsp:Transcript_84065/g.224689  ORF Transcript_84065/g.224689 Transcript_84065/m.224689 type:complete len:274 (+) Transcript_84065:122-943(+)
MAAHPPGTQTLRAMSSSGASPTAVTATVGSLRVSPTKSGSSPPAISGGGATDASLASRSSTPASWRSSWPSRPPARAAWVRSSRSSFRGGSVTRTGVVLISHPAASPISLPQGATSGPAWRKNGWVAARSTRAIWGDRKSPRQRTRSKRAWHRARGATAPWRRAAWSPSRSAMPPDWTNSTRVSRAGTTSLMCFTACIPSVAVTADTQAEAAATTRNLARVELEFDPSDFFFAPAPSLLAQACRPCRSVIGSVSENTAGYVSPWHRQNSSRNR